MTTIREIRLKSRPVGLPTADNFELASVELPAPEVHADDEGEGIVSLVVDQRDMDAGLSGGETVALDPVRAGLVRRKP